MINSNTTKLYPSNPTVGQLYQWNGFRMVPSMGTPTSQNILFATNISPNPSQGTFIFVGTLTSNITIGNPTGGPYIPCTQMAFGLYMDATGGRTVTFGSAYKTVTAIDTTASQTTMIGFMFDGNFWREMGRSEMPT